MRKLLMGLLLVTGSSAWATVTLLNVTGASAVANIPTPTFHQPGTLIQPWIYGGLSGSNSQCKGNSDGTCNSCTQTTGSCPSGQVLQSGANGSAGGFTQAPLCACNPKRIRDATGLVITFTSTSAGVPVIASSGHSTFITTGVVTSGNQNAGATAFLKIPWAYVCQSMFENNTAPSCESALGATSSLTGALRIGISSDGVSFADSETITLQLLKQNFDQIETCDNNQGGVCGWQTYAAHKGVYFEHAQGDSGFSGSTVSAIHIYAAMEDFDHANPVYKSAEKVMPVAPDGSISDNFFGHLRNTLHYFRIATVDKAGNLGNFSSDSNITNPKLGDCSQGGPGAVFPMDADITDGCRYHALPGKALSNL